MTAPTPLLAVVVVTYNSRDDIDDCLDGTLRLTASDDVKKGDVLLTSGIGGVFPPGIPVGIVTAFQQDPAMTFLSAQVMPLARPTYGRYLLLLETYTPATVPDKPDAERKP